MGCEFNPQICSDLESLFLNVLNGPNGALPKGSIIQKSIPNFGTLKWVALREDVSGPLQYKTLDRNADDFQLQSNKFRDALNHLYNSVMYLDDQGIMGLSSTCSFDAKIILYYRHHEPGKKTLGYYLEKVYRAGGVPFGWKGKYPEGHIRVYWPYDVKPTFEED